MLPPCKRQFKNSTPKCLRCGVMARTRGVCVKCYDHYRNLVRDGETTWADLEAAGLVLPPRKNLIYFPAVGRTTRRE